MRYCVNEACIGCGMCAAVCPEIFQMNDNGAAQAVEMDVPAAQEAAAQEACAGCPVGAIEEG